MPARPPPSACLQVRPKNQHRQQREAMAILPINQSINQSINRSINQYRINKQSTTKQSILQTFKQSINPHYWLLYLIRGVNRQTLAVFRTLHETSHLVLLQTEAGSSVACTATMLCPPRPALQEQMVISRMVCMATPLHASLLSLLVACLLPIKRLPFGSHAHLPASLLLFLLLFDASLSSRSGTAQIIRPCFWVIRCTPPIKGPVVCPT